MKTRSTKITWPLDEILNCRGHWCCAVLLAILLLSCVSADEPEPIPFGRAGTAIPRTIDFGQVQAERRRTIERAMAALTAVEITTPKDAPQRVDQPGDPAKVRKPQDGDAIREAFGKAMAANRDAVEAAKTLGGHRAEEAVEMLCEKVMLIPLMESSLMSWSASFPCQAALVRIGKPSVEHILKIMPTEQDRDRLRAYGEVLRRIEGDKRAKELVGILAERADTPNKKKLMNLVVEHIEEQSKSSPVAGLLEEAAPKKP